MKVMLKVIKGDDDEGGDGDDGDDDDGDSTEKQVSFRWKAN